MTDKQTEALIAGYRPDDKEENLVEACLIAIGHVIGDSWYVCPQQQMAKVSDLS